jgi:hypothetical protein
MAVGQHQAVRRDDDAGADAAPTLALPFGAPRLHAHHGGADLVGDRDHGIGIGVEDRRLAVADAGGSR